MARALKLVDFECDSAIWVKVPNLGLSARGNQKAGILLTVTDVYEHVVVHALKPEPAGVQVERCEMRDSDKPLTDRTATK